MVTGIISADLLAMGLPDISAGSQRSVRRRCEVVTNKDYRKISVT